jgi:hypothetical protein
VTIDCRRRKIRRSDRATPAPVSRGGPPTSRTARLAQKIGARCAATPRPAARPQAHASQIAVSGP